MLLAIDTTSTACSCALYDGALVAGLEHIEEKGHAELLLPQIEKLLTDAHLTIKQVTRIAVTTGPGSFTGVRVGIAAARGLALALDCPLVGLTSFEALAATVLLKADGKKFPLKTGSEFSIVFDARRDQVYMQTFVFEGAGVKPKPTTQPQALDISAASALFANTPSLVLGSGAKLVGGDDDGFFTGSDFQHILARNFCSYIDAFKVSDPTAPTPLYLRAPDAKPAFSFLTKGL